ncbi:ISH3-like element ISC1439A family transposase [Saccharolobus solfataricus]|uniref:ISH3-like element ISC1439A family transposase n=2 Tax=Saccharolobus solfataricus TaxID=2287 RepID=A0A0E3MDQ2_SACSO|nr:ISH3-like element ISC1439A family transposase [Saccharolobus solfataricus]AKA74623.1 ISH3-like element ISC1439A family transposase [Saccharolobus solfataricus]AKA74669.1 ISH3-like element ISC1439A family transposase [Saccharolobus solfataricus]AKA74744.1 ISH3-like element ISC1439A family transposase [Saccharolobus solfataricus]AKA77319.1 ISH3-like element ISC1439A family transposase [Saccharolobus solfataricus]AKA77363.1 ISH3-like element ISC1439A family transposase [Saccharolobus solfatari
MQTIQVSKTELKSLAINLATININVISQDLDPEIVKAAPSLLTGNRGKYYLKVVRRGEKVISKGQRTFKFYPIYREVKGEINVVAVDETGLTVGEKEQEKAEGFLLYNWKRKGVKMRSLDLVYPLRLPLLVEVADLRSDSPSQFLLRSVREVSQYMEIDYVVADAGFLNLGVIKEMPVKTIVRGKSNLKGFKELSNVPLVEKRYEVKDKVYVAYRVLKFEGLYYYDVVYVKGKPRHFMFVTNFEGDPYELAELYRLRWQVEEGFKVRKARIRYVRKLSNKIFLFLYYTVLDSAWNLVNHLLFNFKSTCKKVLSFDSFVKLL